jgi:hypothetical protein
MSGHTHTSSTGPALTWESIKAALETLGPVPPRADEYETRVSEWVPMGQVLVIDNDRMLRAPTIEPALGRVHVPLRMQRPEHAPRWTVIAHPDAAKGRDLAELGAIAVMAAIKKQREQEKAAQE